MKRCISGFTGGLAGGRHLTWRRGEHWRSTGGAMSPAHALAAKKQRDRRRIIYVHESSGVTERECRGLPRWYDMEARHPGLKT